MAYTMGAGRMDLSGGGRLLPGHAIRARALALRRWGAVRERGGPPLSSGLLAVAPIFSRLVYCDLDLGAVVAGDGIRPAGVGDVEIVLIQA